MNNKEVFDNINNLYSQYHFLYEKQQENYVQYKVAFEREKNNLFLAVLKLYCQNNNSKNWDFVDSITEEIDAALEKFPEVLKKNQDKKKKQLSFSQYVCVKINNRLGKEKSIQIAEKNNGGSHISEHEARMIRTIKNEVEFFKNYDLTETELIKEISLRRGIGEKTVRKYLKLTKCNRKLIDAENGSKPSYLETPETEFLNNKEQNKKAELLSQVLDAMERFHDKSDKMETQVLTVHLLKEYKDEKKDAVAKECDFLITHKSVYELLKNYQFIDKEILVSFFEDMNYSLKTDKEIEDDNNMKKGAAKHKWDRFIEKMKKNNPDFE